MIMETDMRMLYVSEEIAPDEVAVIVPTFNGGAVWLDCINTLKAQSRARDHVLNIREGLVSSQTLALIC